MGYSVAVKFKNNEEKEKMKNFLTENKDILDKMFECDFMKGFGFDNEIKEGSYLSYSSQKKNLLGFHGVIIPNYIWNLCAWMSVKADAKSKENYYFYYDDSRIKVTTDRNNIKDTVIEESGIPLKKEKQAKNLDFIAGPIEMQIEQRNLLIELDNKWISELKKEENINCGKKVKP